AISYPSEDETTSLCRLNPNRVRTTPPRSGLVQQ
ncbi:MAG: hypothetical protein ACI9VS_001124, partial [Candidatus Binatia bacterium]